MARILVVEDDPKLREFLENALALAGHSVACSEDGMEALQAQQEHPADLIILDLLLPGMDGFAFLQHLRQNWDEVPVLVLTGMGGERDKVMALGYGADDYVVKPFSTVELLARIKAILRRTLPSEKRTALRSGPYTIDLLQLDVFLNGQPLGLTPREFQLLMSLLARPGQTMSRQELVARTWDADERPAPRTVDVHIMSLRRKMENDVTKNIIITIDGQGYRWALPMN